MDEKTRLTEDEQREQRVRFYNRLVDYAIETKCFAKDRNGFSPILDYVDQNKYGSLYTLKKSLNGIVQSCGAPLLFNEGSCRGYIHAVTLERPHDLDGKIPRDHHLHIHSYLPDNNTSHIGFMQFIDPARLYVSLHSNEASALVIAERKIDGERPLWLVTMPTSQFAKCEDARKNLFKRATYVAH